MKDVFGIIGLKVYGLMLGITALVLGLAGVADSTRRPGVIATSQYNAVSIGQSDRSDVLLYFGKPAAPAVQAAESQLAVATKRRSGCLTYRAEHDRPIRYRLCFDPASDELTSKRQVG
jgi:hypothetical protein